MKALEKNRTKTLLVYLLCITLTMSCKKSGWYDVKSDKQLAVPTTLKDMQALLDNGAVMNTFTPGLGESASDGHSLNNTAALALTGTAKNAYTWSHDQEYVRVAEWLNTANKSGTYGRVYCANIVLDGLPKIHSSEQGDQVTWDNIKGQALFHRAHAFYELSQVFAPPYESSTATSKLGVPLRLESDINIPSKRSTLQQTYDQVINDLILAKDLLPESPQYKVRPSKQAVYALLARIYLSMENYDQAEIYSKVCLNSYSTLMDYKTLNVTTTANPIMVYNPEVIFYCYGSSAAASLSFSSRLIDQSLYASYSSNDLRKKVFFNINNSTGLVTYKGTYSGIGFSNFFSGLATDEIYLIHAECSARLGKVAEAMADLNTLLKTRWNASATIPANPYVDLVAADKDDALRKVLEERKKELIMRGLRWSDLRRLNRDPRFAVTITRTVGGKIYTLEPNSYKYTFPIPDDVIQMTGMEQNPGW